MLCWNWNWNLICKYNRHSKSHEFWIFAVFVVANKLQKIFLTIIVQSHSAFICVWLIFFHFLGSGGLIYTSFFSWIIKKNKKFVKLISRIIYLCFVNIFQVLGSGMNLHLSDNDLVRSIFGLGAPLPALDKLSSKPSKHERVRQ